MNSPDKKDTDSAGISIYDKSSFFKDTVVLVSGTTVSALIVLLASPFITRLFGRIIWVFCHFFFRHEYFKRRCLFSV